MMSKDSDFFPVEIQTEGWQARVAGLDTGKLT